MHMTDNCVSVNVCWARTLLLIKKEGQGQSPNAMFQNQGWENGPLEEPGKDQPIKKEENSGSVMFCTGTDTNVLKGRVGKREILWESWLWAEQFCSWDRGRRLWSSRWDRH